MMDILTNQTPDFNKQFKNRSYRILVVDDSPMDLHMLINGLSDAFSVNFAHSAQEALCLVTQFPQPDLILLDIVMPEMDGYQLCNRLKNDEATSHIPIIFISANDNTFNKTKGFNAGAVDYVTKPIEIVELEARIQTHIRLKEQSRYLESMAYFDPLTRVANRRKYNEVLQREWSRCIRYHHQMSMVLVDIDFFKEYNEAYGHAEGDNCLINIARQLEKVVGRPADVFARIGGEEFVLVLPDCNALGAVQKGEKMLDTVRNAKLPHSLSSISKFVTISVGVATVFPSQGHSALSLFQAADDALFTAKREGRNQLAVAQLDTLPGLTGEGARQHH